MNIPSSLTKRIPGFSGERSGRLTLLKRVGYTPGSSLWQCRCDCGNKPVIRLGSFRFGRTKSCGCLYKQAKSHGDTVGKKTAEWYAWTGMRYRCSNKNSKDWVNYGGRGITVCSRWIDSYANFLADIGRKPDASYSIDRINNDGNYEPDNCRWATRREQNLNTRRNK